MAATHKSRAKAQAEGKGIPMTEDEGDDTKKEQHDDVHVDKDDKAKGQPAENGRKRSRTPEGGGVAGSRDTKRHKNAYEISKYPVTW